MSQPGLDRGFIYTEWKGNKFYPLAVVGDGLKDQKIYTYNMGSKLDSFLRKGVSCSALSTSYCLQYIVRDNAKKYT